MTTSEMYREITGAIALSPSAEHILKSILKSYDGETIENDFYEPKVKLYLYLDEDYKETKVIETGLTEEKFDRMSNDEIKKMFFPDIDVFDFEYM